MEIFTLQEANIEKAIRDIALCHLKSFPHQFLSRMGIDAIAGYYRANLKNNEIICVAYKNENLVGYVSGGSEQLLKQYRSELFHSNPLKSILSTLNMDVLRSAWNMLFHTSQNNEFKQKHHQFYYLSVIAVYDAYWGMKISESILSQFEKECVNRGQIGFYLNVSNTNKRAISFYIKSGMSISNIGIESTTMIKRL